MADRLADIENFDLPDYFVEGAKSEFCHQFSDLLRDELNKVHDEFRLPREVLA